MLVNSPAVVVVTFLSAFVNSWALGISLIALAHPKVFHIGTHTFHYGVKVYIDKGLLLLASLAYLFC